MEKKTRKKAPKASAKDVRALKRRIKNLGLSQIWLAHRLNISRSYLSLLLAGRYKMKKRFYDKIDEFLQLIEKNINHGKF